MQNEDMGEVILGRENNTHGVCPQLWWENQYGEALGICTCEGREVNSELERCDEARWWWALNAKERNLNF